MTRPRWRRGRSLSTLSLPQLLSYLFTLFIFFAVLWIAQAFQPPPMPRSEGPVVLYANQVQQDLKQLFVAAIGEAESSILLIIYALSDDHLIQQLKEKSLNGVEVKVICDAGASRNVARKLGPQVQCTLRKGSGLMHDKILVVDRKKVWMGSANWTGESLRFHGNLVVGLENPSMAEDLIHYGARMAANSPLLPQSSFCYQVGVQKMELWLLPNQAAVGRMVRLIRSAQKTVRIAMFTWTRKDFAQEVVAAHRRGVKTAVVLDRQAAKGAGKAVTELLRKGGIAVRCNQGNTLLHHKFMYIDGEILINGSANWTKAAFAKNDDCALIIEDLTEEQREYMEELWEVIIKESSCA